VSPRRVLQAGMPWLSPPLPTWVSWPRPWAPCAAGFSFLAGAAGPGGGHGRCPLGEPWGPALAGLSPPGAREDGGGGEGDRYRPCSRAAAATRRAVNYNLLAVNKCCLAQISVRGAALRPLTPGETGDETGRDASAALLPGAGLSNAAPANPSQGGKQPGWKFPFFFLLG